MTASASPITTVDTSSRDEIVDERAATLSRSLGVGRGLASLTEKVTAAAPTASPDTLAPSVTPDATPVPTPVPPPIPTPAPTPSVDDARSFALAQIGPAQFSCLDALWEHESNWDPTAENPTSGAYGIAQALPAAKMGSAGDDWMSNPITQVSWGLDYITTRYGSACNAWSFWLNHYPHWY